MALRIKFPYALSGLERPCHLCAEYGDSDDCFVCEGVGTIEADPCEGEEVYAWLHEPVAADLPALNAEAL